MPFDWMDFLGLAQELSAQTDAPSYRDARLRSAISRAYYAAYHHAREYLAKRGEYRPSNADHLHLYVRDVFRNSKDSARQKIGNNLDRLRLDRTEADYEIAAKHIGGETAEKDVILARKIIDDIAKLTPTRTRDQN
jgi:uncharacterized protein (UPF0332 family)